MKKKYILTAITTILTVCLIRIGMHFFYTDYSKTGTMTKEFDRRCKGNSFFANIITKTLF